MRGSSVAGAGEGWEAAMEATQLGNFHFHDLRHTVASWAVQRRVTLPELWSRGRELNPRPTDYEGVAARPLFQQVPRKCVTRRSYGSLHVSYQSRWSILFSTARAEKGKNVSAALQRNCRATGLGPGFLAPPGVGEAPRRVLSIVRNRRVTNTKEVT